jgi:hypothetical protein
MRAPRANLARSILLVAAAALATASASHLLFHFFQLSEAYARLVLF